MREVFMRSRTGDGLAPSLCNIFGTLLIVAVFALILPLAVPQLLGYQVFDVVSGSMEPAIPTGSAIYVRAVEPQDVQEDEIIAFHEDDAVVAHRVLANRTSLGEFVTKGDANNVEDLAPIPYDALIGKVVMTIPALGMFMALYTSTVGKVYLFLTLACGVMLNMLADRMRTANLMRERNLGQRLENDESIANTSDKVMVEDEPVGTPSDELSSPATAEPSSPRSRGWLRTVLIGVLALVFFGSLGVVLFVKHQYHVSDETYEAAAQSYTTVQAGGTMAPIVVDFDSLRAANEDVVGWIYCPDSRINYPVLQGETNDTYLRHDYLGDYNINGSVFVDCDNAPGFTDANTIIYGHHMNEGAMFATLDQWANQEFYESHPVMWLLTPEQDYQVVLVSGHHTSASSNMYDIYREHDERFARFLQEAASLSDFKPLEQATLNLDRNYIMLTTCAYIFDNARYVLHGKLVPVDSAGGKPKAASK
ncbi:MAG: class B sortase [Atopobiaceae bacterium]|nr:class B sortase [Atopobiaceae bacterium]